MRVRRARALCLVLLVCLVPLLADASAAPPAPGESPPAVDAPEIRAQALDRRTDIQASQPATEAGADKDYSDWWPEEIIVPLPGLATYDEQLVLVRVPDGYYWMGSPEGERGRDDLEEFPPHPRYIGPPFYMGKYEVTQAQWKAVMGYLPAMISGDGRGPDYPIHYVSFDEIETFVERLETDDVRDSLVEQVGVRGWVGLPSEAEWEYAVRAKTQTRFFFGDSLLGCTDDDHGDCPAGLYPGTRYDYMWCGGNFKPGHFGAHKVGQLDPNDWGLYDMHGNVDEFVEDHYRLPYEMGRPSNGKPWCGVDLDGKPLGWRACMSSPRYDRVVRGGSYALPATWCRSASRGQFAEDSPNAYLGFRLANAPFRYSFRSPIEMGDYEDFKAESKWSPRDSRWRVLEAKTLVPSASTANHVYQMTGDGGGVGSYSHYQGEFTDASYQVDARKVSGDSPEMAYAYGLYIRSDGQQQDYYSFGITVDGAYMVGRSVDGSFAPVVEWTRSDALKTGYGEWNCLKVVAIEDTFQFYANGEFLVALRDESFSAGKVGLYAVDASGSTQRDVVQFDNADLHGPESAAPDEQHIYLPLVVGKLRAAGKPTPGAWSGGGIDFRVTPGSGQVDDFAAQMNLPGCGTLTIRRNSPVNIVNGSFSFTGSFYASGTFGSSTTASGVVGLKDFSVEGCDTYTGSGPWAATWQGAAGGTADMVYEE